MNIALSWVYRQRALLSQPFSPSSSFVCIFKYSFGSEIADIESPVPPHNCRYPVGSFSNQTDFCFMENPCTDISSLDDQIFRTSPSVLNPITRNHEIRLIGSICLPVSLSGPVYAITVLICIQGVFRSKFSWLFSTQLRFVAVSFSEISC